MSETDFWREVREVAREALRDELYRPTGITPGVHNGITFDRYGKATFAGLSAGGAGFDLDGQLTVLADTIGTVTWGTPDVNYNDGSAFWGTTNPERILIPSAGRYIVSAYVAVTHSGTPDNTGTVDVSIVLRANQGTAAGFPRDGLARRVEYLAGTGFLLRRLELNAGVVWDFHANEYVFATVQSSSLSLGTPAVTVSNCHVSIQRVS